MSEDKNPPKIKIVKDGPYLVSGNIPMAKQTILVDNQGHGVKMGRGNLFSHERAVCTL